MSGVLLLGETRRGGERRSAMMRGVACLFRLCGSDLDMFSRVIPVCDVEENRQWRSVGPDERLPVYFLRQLRSSGIFAPFSRTLSLVLCTWK